MVITGNLVAQWVAIITGFIYFLWKQGKESGGTTTTLEAIKEDLIGIKASLSSDIHDTKQRMYLIESKFNATGDDRIMFWGQHDRIQGECQRRLLEKIQMNAEVFERVASRMDIMDDRRESKREKDDERLRAIENSIATMTESLKHLAIVIDRREPHITKED